MFIRNGDRITLEMRSEDFNSLLLIMGFALGSSTDDQERFWRWVALVNRINEGNPDFRQYEIPEEMKKSHGL